MCADGTFKGQILVEHLVKFYIFYTSSFCEEKVKQINQIQLDSEVVIP